MPPAFPLPNPNPLPIPFRPVFEFVFGTPNSDYFGPDASGRFRTTDLADRIYGWGGDDFIFGAGGDDVLDGGAGRDRIDGQEGNDRLFGLDGDDRLDGGSGDDVLSGSDGRDRLDGGNGDDALSGGVFEDTLSDFGTGADELRGGTDNDIYIVASSGDTVIELPDEGSLDEVRSFISYTLPTNVERLELLTRGTTGTGNDLPNKLISSAEGTILQGGRGGDHLQGGVGTTFRYDSAQESNSFGIDEITMLLQGDEDLSQITIDVAAIDADTMRDNNQVFRWGGTSQRDKGYLWIEQQVPGTSFFWIYGNTDNHPAAEFAIEVETTPGIRLADWTADTFVL